MIKIYISMFILAFGANIFAQESSSSAARNSRCMSTLSRYFAPYVNLPETQGAFEHFQIRSENVGLTDVTYWDDTRELPGSELRSRYIFTPTGGIQCYYPKTLNPSDLVFDEEAFRENSVDVLKRNRTLLPRASIACRKTDRFPSELLETYISWLPQLYGELLNDKSMSADWSRVAGNYTPSQMDFNLNACKSIPGPYRGDIARKLPRLQNNWNSINSEVVPGSTESTTGVD